MSDRASVVTPGNYDGVHRGHRALLDAARHVAAGHVAAGHVAAEHVAAEVVVLTFDPHPVTVLAPDRAPPLLTTIARRTELLLALGADRVEIIEFDRDLAGQTPEQFVRSALVDRLRAVGVVVGPDFRFGKGRAGNFETLVTLGTQLGFEAKAVGPFEHEGEVVSSTRVRAALSSGDVEAATALLMRVHDVSGTVVKGDQRGRTIGFPTANLGASENVLLPADGVYAVVGRTPRVDRLLHGVANLGLRPTFDAGRSFETFFFDFDADLYDAGLRIGFVGRVRAEQKFDGIDALKKQIHLDVSAAREMIGAADRDAWKWI